MQNIRRVYINVRRIEYFGGGPLWQIERHRASPRALSGSLSAYVLKPDWNGGDQAKIGHMPSQTKLACDVE